MTDINGDARLTRRERVLYLVNNVKRNIGFRAGALSTEIFHPDLDRVSDRLTTQSPARILSEAFFQTALPMLLPPRPIDALEIGCGTGSFCRVLADLGYSGSYTGIDVQNRFRASGTAELPFSVSFVQTDAHAYKPDTSYDLVVSMSALEHIYDDAPLLSRMAGRIRPGSMQLHLVPSGWGLFCYLWHGWRQYPLGAIERRFAAAHTQVFRLGGIGTLSLHFFLITVPEILFGFSLRNRLPGFYRGLLKAALWVDCRLPVAPVFYAVVERH